MENMTYQQLNALFENDENDFKLVECLTNFIKKYVHIIYFEEKKYTIYIWNNELKLYESRNEDRLIYFISSLINKSIDSLTQEQQYYLKNNDTTKKGYKRFMHHTTLKSLSKDITGAMQELDFKIDDRRDVLNFKNGLLSLKDGSFRERTMNDYFSCCLDFNYNVKSTDKYIKELKQRFFNIFNCDEELNEFLLSWLGYSLTGETKLEKFLMFIGISASNGKTMLMNILSKVFSIYAKKIDKQTFKEGYEKQHKFLISCQAPLRIVYCEELATDLLDSSLMKDFTSGIINCEVMYSTNSTFYILAKLMTNSNFDPRFKNDSGMERRLIAVRLLNRFLDQDKYDEEIEKHTTGIFLKDKNFLDMFDNVEYKLALVHLLLPYAIKYYKTGELTIPKNIEKISKKLCEENDRMKEFIKAMIITTDNIEDLISKEIFEIEYKIYTDIKHISDITLTNEAKRCGLKYNAEKRHKGSRGFFTGIRFRTDDDDKIEEEKQKLEEQEKPVKITKIIKSSNKKIIKEEIKHEEIEIEEEKPIKKIIKTVKNLNKKEVKQEIKEVIEEYNEEDNAFKILFN